MKQEEKELLLSLLLRLDEEGLLNVYDNDDSHHEVDWIFFDKEELCIKIK
jgi:hypothetical protein